MQKYPKGMQKLGRGMQCIKMGKRRHNRIHALIHICEKPQKCSEMGIFSYLLVAYHLIYLIFIAFFAKLLDIKRVFRDKMQKNNNYVIKKNFSTLT